MNAAMDVERIAFVSRRFNELKGLNAVVAGSIVVFVALLHSLAGHSGQEPPQAFAIVSPLCVGTIVGILILERRYRSTFGRPVSESALDVFTYLGTSLSTAMLMGALWDQIVEGHLGGPSGAAVVVAIASSIVVVRDWRWRPYYLVPLSVALMTWAVTAQTASGQPLHSWEHDPQRGQVFLFTYAALGLAIIVAGVFDHWLLMSLLRRDSDTWRPPDGLRSPGLPRMALYFSGYYALALLTPAYLMGHILSAPLLVLSFVLTFRQGRLRSGTALLGLHQPTGEGDDPSWSAPLTASRWPLSLVLILAAAAALDTSRPAHGPVFTEITFAACALAGALTTTPRRWHYLAGLGASILALATGSWMEPAPALSLFLCTVSASVAFAAFVDGQAMPVFGELNNADTI